MMRFCVRLCQVLVLVGCLPNVAMAAGVACYDSHFFPVDGSTVPSNLPGVWFWPRWGIYEDSEQDAGGDVAQEVAFFVRDEDGTLEPVSFTVEGSGAPYLLVPSEGFSAGSVYQLWSQGCVDETLPASYPPPQIGLPAGLNSPIPYATITTTEMAEPPAELPAVKVAAPVREVIAYLGDCTGCGGPYDAVSVYIELAKPHGPWQDALALTTWVDDAVYQPSPYAKYRTLEGFSWVGHGRDRLSALCGGEDEQILSEGTHRARFAATIPGLDMRASRDRGHADRVIVDTGIG